MPPFNGVSTDSRTLNPGELFVALSGPRFNGEDYVAAAVARGAAGAVVRTEQAAPAARSWSMTPWRRWPAARSAWREGFAHSAGRCRRQQRQDHGQGADSGILSQAGPCLSTRGNLNNHIGVPLTLFRIARRTSLRGRGDGCGSGR